MGTTTEPVANGYLVMVIVHRAMARDLQQISDAARQLSQRPDDRRTAALIQYADRVIQLIDHHHEGEDDVLWPMLRDRGAPAEALDLMASEHHELAELLHQLQKLIGSAGDGPAVLAEIADKTAALRQLLVVHTADEERELNDRLKPALGEKEWGVFQRHMVTSAPKWTLWFMPPWMATAATTPQERKALPAAPVAWLMRGRLRRQREAAFGASA
ncbi:hemerythrin domain-containing protein [Micromonospora sp. NPDC003944]